MQIAAIEVKHLVCHRGGEIIVPDANFEVGAGQALLLRGPNGSGKTTLLRTLAGFLAPAGGQIVLCRDGAEEIWQPEVAHYIGHANGIKARLSVLENVRFWQRFYGGTREHDAASWFETARSAPPHHEVSSTEQSAPPHREVSSAISEAPSAGPHPEERRNAAPRRMEPFPQNSSGACEAALDAFGLLHLAEYRAAHLSQGQARRLGLARLLAAGRAVWLLDEPSVSLDAASTRMLEAAIAAHLAGGGIAIIATHGDIVVANADVLQLGSKAAS